MKPTSKFALLDVTKGRKKLAKHIEKNGPVRVTVTGIITEPWGHDDGVSQEFGVCVDSLKVEAQP